MKKLGSLISILCVINVLMLLGIVGFLWGTGRLDKPKAQAIGDLLRQPGTPDHLRAKIYDIMAPATQTQPATGTAPATHVNLAGVEVPAAAQDRIDYVQRVLENERLALERQAQELRVAQEALENRARELDALDKKLKAERKDYELTLTSSSTKTDAAGFAKSMAIFEELKPKQVKDLLASMPAPEVARYLTAMEPDRAAKVMAEFKSTEEKTLINAVLDQMRGVKDAAGTGAAPGTPTASPPQSQPVAAPSAPKAGP